VGVAEYRVEELARAAGTSVRNVRVYQERGLLPPPRRVGRTGVYTDAHLARLRLIRLLLGRGYTFATIGELIEAWSVGQGIGDLLGLDDAIAVPWTDEEPEVVPMRSLDETFSESTPETVRRAENLGLFSVRGDQVVVPSPRLLEAGAQLVRAGVPLEAVLDLAEDLSTRLGEVAELMFDMFGRYIMQDGRSGKELAELLMRLRPLAGQTVDAMMAIALAQESRRILEYRTKRRDGGADHQR
jgi:DNA-binding transcriptional MerR regulator